MKSNVLIFLGIIFLLIFLMKAISATTAGPNSGTTFVNDSIGGTINWAAPINAQTANAINASTPKSLTATVGSNFLKATGFSFAIPTGSVINGINVSVKLGGSVAVQRDNGTYIVKDNVIGGTRHADANDWGIALTYKSYATNITDLWGLTWTAENINNATFGVAISSKGSTGTTRVSSIDHIQIAVDYTLYPTFSNYDITYITPPNNSNYSSTTVYRFNSTIINTNGTVGMQFNGTNYTASNLSSVFNASVSNLAAGTYNYYWWARGNGTDISLNITPTMSYTVARATPTLTFKANGGTSNLSLIYPQQVNISATSDNGTVGLDKDNVAYGSNALNVSLSAGSYIFRANITGNTNYSNVGYSYYNITINKTVPQGNLTNTTSWTVTYPTQTNISYSEANTGDGDVKYNVSRDNVYKNGGENVTLGVGTYSYVLNTTGGTNYTANASMDAKTLTVQINNSYVLTLTITPSTTLTYPLAINATGTNCPSELACNLYRNDTSGALTNGANYTLGAGIYNITYNTTGNTNYSAKSVSQILTINKATLTGSLTNTTSLTVTYPLAINVSYTETNTGDSDVAYLIYRDNVDVTATEKGLNVTLSVGNYNYILNSTGGANYTANASISNFTITVAQATPVIIKLLNGGTSNITITYPQQVNATGSSTGGTIKIFRDETDVTSENGANVSLSAGGYIYKFNVTGNTNYSSIAGQYMQVNISKAASSVNLTLNNSESNVTITVETAIDLNCSRITGDSGAILTLYQEGSLINSGTSPIGNTTTFDTIRVENITCAYSDSQNYTTSSETWFVKVQAANTCACAGLDKNWEINLADSCVIDTACNLGTGKLNFTGSGNVTCNANINTTSLGDVGANGIMYVNSGCYMLVDG